MSNTWHRGHAGLAGAGIFVSAVFASAGLAQPVTTGLKVHLSADTITGVESNDPLLVWPDQAESDGVQSAERSLLADGPALYVADDGAGRPTVRFDGTAGLAYQGSLGLTEEPAGDAYTIFVVGTTTDPAYRTQRAFHLGDIAGVGVDEPRTGYSVAMDVNAQSFGARMNNGNALGPAGVGFSAEPSIGVLRNGLNESYDDVDVLLNGDSIAASFGNPENRTTLRDDGYMVGFGTVASGESIDNLVGDIYEILYYNVKLTDDEVQQVNEYLADKYGIEIPREFDPADMDEDGDVDVQDLLAYLRAFRAAPRN